MCICMYSVCCYSWYILVITVGILDSSFVLLVFMFCLFVFLVWYFLLVFVCVFCLFFFFFKQKTAYEMRISDWSSDVCSSDLRRAPPPAGGSGQARPSQAGPGDGPVPPPAGGAWLGVLAPQGLYGLARAGSLYAPRHRRRGISRGQDAADPGRAPVGTIRPLGQVQDRKNVVRGKGGSGRVEQ